MSGMTFCRKIWLILVATIHVLCGTLWTSAAENSCPDVFRYEGSPGSEYGIITVPNPYPYLAINMSVAVYATAPVTLYSRTKLEPVDKHMWRKMAAGSRDPVFYRLVFPVSSPLPTIKNITVNKNIICTGSKPNGAYFGIITVQHALYDQKCNSASLDCPFNIQQSADIRPQSSQKEDFSPVINSVVFQRGLSKQNCSVGNADCNDNSIKSDLPVRLERAAFHREPAKENPSPTPSFSRSPPGSDTYTRCGIPAARRVLRVVDGQDTSHGQWPWHAALFTFNGYSTLYRCGGTLVGTRTIITAVHCVTTLNGKAMAPEELIVTLGRYDLTIRKEEGAQEMDVQRVIPHPAYNYSNSDANIALLILNSSVEYTRFVRPACLWNPSYTSLEGVIGKEGVVVGWGRDERELMAQKLKMVIAPIVSRETCYKNNEEFYLTFVHTTNFCAGYANGSTPCNGDSGGGMVIPINQQDDSTAWTLRGIVSHSRLVDGTCDPNNYVVYTDVAQYLYWIYEFLI